MEDTGPLKLTVMPSAKMASDLSSIDQQMMLPLSCTGQIRRVSTTQAGAQHAS